MNHRLVCTLGLWASAPFGVAFLLAPLLVGSVYGAMPADAFTSSLGRYFGSELLLFSAALWALREVRDPAAQRKAAVGIAFGSIVGLAVTLHAALTGTMNAMAWSTVAIYAFFTWAWGRLALAGGSTAS